MAKGLSFLYVFTPLLIKEGCPQGGVVDQFVIKKLFNALVS